VYLIDTCAISEMYRKRPDRGVVQFFEQASQSILFMSVITLGELTRGVALVRQPGERAAMAQWYAALRTRFQYSLLDVDETTAEIWGRLSVEAQLSGRAFHVTDGLIAATAIRHELAVVTRNERDFAGTGAAIVNPWGQE